MTKHHQTEIIHTARRLAARMGCEFVLNSPAVCTCDDCTAIRAMARAISEVQACGPDGWVHFTEEAHAALVAFRALATTPARNTSQIGEG